MATGADEAGGIERKSFDEARGFDVQKIAMMSSDTDFPSPGTILWNFTKGFAGILALSGGVWWIFCDKWLGVGAFRFFSAVFFCAVNLFCDFHKKREPWG